MAFGKFQIPYGRTQLEFNFDSDNCITIDKQVTAANSQTEIIETAINKPENLSNFENFFQISDKIAIIVPDKTRKSGTPVYLPVILDRLKNSGIKKDNIILFFANGTHESMSEADKQEILGNKIYREYKHIEHDCRDNKNLKYLGTTKFGTEIYINSEVLTCNKILLTGSINFHYMAGFGGGLKTLIPGMAGIKTTLYNHSFTIHPEKPGLNPKCREGILEDNPIYDDISTILDYIKDVSILNTILNENGEIIDAVFGHPVTAFKTGCKKLIDYFEIPVAKKADLLIISPGNYPKDINLIQTHKSINRCWNLLKENGIMIVAAECTDGIGSRTLMEWFEYEDIKKMHEALLSGFKMNGNTALSYRMKAIEKRIFMISSLDKDILDKIGIVKFNTPDNALKTANNMLPDNPLTYIIPNSSFIFPVFSN